jgi:hypothetical protein
MSVYGYGTDFIGGVGYPKVQRQMVYAEPEKWAKAAIYNAAVVKENPWVKHLRENGVYDEIRNILNKTKATYKPVNPVKRTKNLTRELNRVKKIYALVNPEYPEVRQEYYFKTPYDEAKAAALARLIKQANRLAKELDVQVQLPKPTVNIPEDYLK